MCLRKRKRNREIQRLWHEKKTAWERIAGLVQKKADEKPP